MNGYFVDWNGFVRSCENPGNSYRCQFDPTNPKCVWVVTECGEVIFEATWWESIEVIMEVFKEHGIKEMDIFGKPSIDVI